MFRFFSSKFGMFVFFLAVIILLIFLHYLKVLRPVENLIFICSQSVERSAYKVSNKVSGFFNLIISIRNLSEENGVLLSENQRLLLENTKLKEAREENRFLRELLDLKEESGISGLPAEVIGRNPDSLVQSIKIDQGKSVGVEEGASVIAGGGFLVGRVIESYYNTAKVLLITDQNSVINVLVSGSRANGNISGQHGLGLLMDMIPQTEVVNVGDEVITSGVDDELPKGLIVGEVVRVESSANQLFQKAQVKPYINFAKLEHVLVIGTIEPKR